MYGVCNAKSARVCVCVCVSPNENHIETAHRIKIQFSTLLPVRVHKFFYFYQKQYRSLRAITFENKNKRPVRRVMVREKQNASH